METNPVFRLELIQARRSGFLLFLFLGGCLTQGVWLFLVLEPGRLGKLIESLRFGFYLVNLVFKLLPIIIVGWASLKLASQQVNDDPILHTPLSSRTILGGKLQAVLVMILCLYLPGIPVTVYHSFTEWGYYGLLLFPCGIGKLLCWAAIGMGFMAGARSSTLRVVLAGLCVFFFVVLYASTTMLQSTVWNPLTRPYWTNDYVALRPQIYFFHTIWQYLNLAFLSLLAVLFYGMGAAVMRRNRIRQWSMKRVFLGAGLLAAVGSLMIAILISLFNLYFGPRFAPPVIFIVPWTALIFIPAFTLLAVVLHDRNNKVKEPEASASGWNDQETHP